MSSHNSPVHIVTARVRIHQRDGQQIPTENKLVRRTAATKRSRPGIANVEVFDIDDNVMDNNMILGLAVYDRQHKTGVSDMALLITGVAEITCTVRQMELLQNGRYRIAKVLRKIDQIGPTANPPENTLCVWRVFWNFNPSEAHYGNVASLAGLESTEPHFVQTRTFNFNPEQEYLIDSFDAGKTVSGRFDNTLSNALEAEATAYAFEVLPITQGLAGIMLWPLTKKAIKAKSEQYKKAAVMCRGVATLYMQDEDLEDMRQHILTGIYHFYPGTANLNNFTADNRDQLFSSGFLGQVLEVYQSSVRIRIIAHAAKEYPWQDYQAAMRRTAEYLPPPFAVRAGRAAAAALGVIAPGRAAAALSTATTEATTAAGQTAYFAGGLLQAALIGILSYLGLVGNFAVGLAS